MVYSKTTVQQSQAQPKTETCSYKKQSFNLENSLVYLTSDKKEEAIALNWDKQS